MPIKFDPQFEITTKIAQGLMRIAELKEKVMHLPLTPSVLISLRETARLYTTHYSTMIEGNQLEPDQIHEVIKENKHFSGREREEKEVRGFYAALKEMENLVQLRALVSENLIQKFHAWIMSDGRIKVKTTPYRDGQNVIRDQMTRKIVYMPPEAKDVPPLMEGLILWISQNEDLPLPLIAALAHYQFATIHPYYDGNGRTARLLTTFILHYGGYGLKGLYCLEEYYAQNLQAYYNAISLSPSHNYYLGREKADITPWIEYFIEGIVIAFENVLERMLFAKQSGKVDQAELMRSLDPKQRLVLELFSTFETVTAQQIGEIFHFQPRTSAKLCKDWTLLGFLEVANRSNKSRKYRLAKKYEKLLFQGN